MRYQAPEAVHDRSVSRRAVIRGAGAVGVMLCRNNNSVAAGLISPGEWLRRQSPPDFRAGHTLPLLTRWGWTLPLEAGRLLAEQWGYALEFGGYVDRSAVDRAFDRPNSAEAQALKLAVDAPEKYKLSVILSREMPAPSQVDDSAWVRREDGTASRMWSPAASDAALDSLAFLQAKPLLDLSRAVRPAVILNGGEYGIGVLGFCLPYWLKDKAIIAAKGDEEWFDYISRMKAKEQKRIRDAVMNHMNGVYVYYTDGGGEHRNRGLTWKNWTYDHRQMIGTGTFPSSQYYYKHFNEGWRHSNLNPFGKGDLLTQALNAKGAEIAAGFPFSYDWVCGGWHRPKAEARAEEIQSGAEGAAVIDPNAGFLSETPAYFGFLKCLYVAGTIGAVSGYFSFPEGGFGRAFPEDSPPHWLLQLTTLARVHAMFSHLEPFVRNSRLISGSRKHAWGEFPAYELGSEQTDRRVLARKHLDRSIWLVVCWSVSGRTENCPVEIEGFGNADLSSDDEAKLYFIVGGTEKRIVELTPGTVSSQMKQHGFQFGN